MNRKRWKCFFPEISLLESVYISENIKLRVTVLGTDFPQKYWKHFFLQVYRSVNSIRASAKMTSAVWETGAKSILFLMELPQQLLFSSAATLLGILREQ